MHSIDYYHYSSPEDNIEAGFYDEPDNIRFYVKDNGNGVPMEYKASIFNKFMQIGKKDDGRTYTTGLGLTFCKMAVEAHKGTIHVESDGKKGSCFIFKLPLK